MGFLPKVAVYSRVPTRTFSVPWSVLDHGTNGRVPLVLMRGYAHTLAPLVVAYAYAGKFERLIAGASTSYERLRKASLKTAPTKPH